MNAHQLVAGQAHAARTVPITYFSDVLCVWAYIAQLRVDEVQAKFGGQVRFETRFCSVFGDTARKIATSWKGEYAAFNAHLRHSARPFHEIRLNPDLWLTVRPASSTGPHLVLKAVQLAEAAGDCAPGAAAAATWAMRRAFFEEGLDIASWDVQREVARRAGVDPVGLEPLVRDGPAFAALAADYREAEAMGVQGSPSFVLNDGRQKLYGNVGYRVIAANISELLRAPVADQASWRRRAGAEPAIRAAPLVASGFSNSAQAR
jgi:predicted DsbA family dithiol-disulfide isomerase